MSEFFNRYIEGTLSEADCDDLLRQIDARPALLEELLQQVRMDARLSEMLEVRDRPVVALQSYASDKLRFLDTIRRLSQVSSDQTVRPVTVSESHLSAHSKALKPFSPERRTPVVLSIALAFCLVGWVGLSILEITGKTWQQLIGNVTAEQENTKVLATISEMSDPVWGRDTVAYRRGEPLFAGPMTLLSGLFSMRLSDGTQVVVNGGTEFSINSQDKITCRSGKMTIQVPSRTEKLIVNLPQCDVIVLGTRFGIEASSLHSDISLMEGGVMLTGFHDDPSRTEYVETGETVRIDSRSEVAQIPTDSEHWTSFEEMTRLNELSLKQERRRWKNAREKRSEEPGLLIALDFEDQSAPEKVSLPLSPIIVGGKTAEGRFSEKKAMLFSDGQGRIELHGSVVLDNLTLTTSIRPDRLDESNSTLFFSKKNVKGAAFWQILSNGQIVFGGADQNRSRSFRNPISLFREQLGTWIHLAIVIDSRQRRVTHYFNGRSVGMERMAESIQIEIDEATIGRRPDDTQKRCFNGCMDEFRIYDRCLKSDEILAIVESYR